MSSGENESCIEIEVPKQGQAFRVGFGGALKRVFFGHIRFEIPLNMLEEMLRRWWDNEIWGSGEKLGVEI